jgi:hypothetical protein
LAICIWWTVIASCRQTQTAITRSRSPRWLKVVFDDDIDLPAHFVKIVADKVILQLRDSNELVVMNRDLVEISRHKGSEDVQGKLVLIRRSLLTRLHHGKQEVDMA